MSLGPTWSTNHEDLRLVRQMDIGFCDLFLADMMQMYNIIDILYLGNSCFEKIITK